MATVQEFEVWVLVDSNGDYAVGKDNASATEDYESNIQGIGACDGFRMVKIILTVPLPEVIELTGTVPEQGQATLEVKGGE